MFSWKYCAVLPDWVKIEALFVILFLKTFKNFSLSYELMSPIAFSKDLTYIICKTGPGTKF